LISSAWLLFQYQASLSEKLWRLLMVSIVTGCPASLKFLKNPIFFSLAKIPKKVKNSKGIPKNALFFHWNSYFFLSVINLLITCRNPAKMVTDITKSTMFWNGQKWFGHDLPTQNWWHYEIVSLQLKVTLTMSVTLLFHKQSSCW
jgi:hypothetical protein